jgi:thiamine biosynthesis protein ThiI
MQTVQTNWEKLEPTDLDSVIVRYGGELGIKGAWTRNAYERRLRKNIKTVLKHYAISYRKIIRKYGRLFLKTSLTTESSTKLARVFGISSLSPALETTSKLEDIIDKTVFLAGLTLHQKTSFAVRCRRVGNHPYSSTDVCKEVGSHVLNAFPERRLKVNLKNPDATLGVEVRDDQAFVYPVTVRGAGGLPLGTQPKVVGLLSGGVDSSVACWLVMKRGCPVVPLYFDNTPYTDEATTERAINVAAALFDWSIGFPRRVYTVSHGPNLAEFKEQRRFERLTCIICKRMMYRIAEKVADTIRAEGIATGEAIGEQASQTLRNLRLLNSAATKYPIHRPLLGFDKSETERIARRIGTYKASIQRAKGCAAVPRKPVTMAKPQDVAEAEEALDIGKMVERSIKTLQIVKL